jgi:ABC-type transport system involved in Fe-S cluster assembly fused permease/ATPase subunit
MGRTQFLKLVALVGYDTAVQIVALKLGYDEATQIEVARTLLPDGYEKQDLIEKLGLN